MFKKIIISTVCLFILCASMYIIHAEEFEEDDIEVVDDPATIDEAGTYFIKAGARANDGNEILGAIRMHVSFPKTELFTENQEGIDAHDIRVEVGKVKGLSSQQLIEKANAHAWSMVNDKKVDITSVTIKETKTVSGDYQVVFATDKGTNTTVSVYEFDRVVLNLKNSYTTTTLLDGFEIGTFTFFLFVFMFFPICMFLIAYLYFQKRVRDVERVLYK